MLPAIPSGLQSPPPRGSARCNLRSSRSLTPPSFPVTPLRDSTRVLRPPESSLSILYTSSCYRSLQESSLSRSTFLSGVLNGAQCSALVSRHIVCCLLDWKTWSFRGYRRVEVDYRVLKCHLTDAFAGTTLSLVVGEKLSGVITATRIPTTVMTQRCCL